MESKELLFEVYAPLGQHCFKVYLDGTVEGFPDGAVVEVLLVNVAKFCYATAP